MNPSSSKESGDGGSGGESVKITTKVDLLELKLGFGTASLKGMTHGSIPIYESSSFSLQSSSQLSAKEPQALGLNLGFQTLNRRRDQVVNPSSSSFSSSETCNNNHGLLWGPHHKQLGFGSYASTSSSPSERPLRTLLLPPVPHNVNVSHHHFSRRPQPAAAGLWFSLRSIINRNGEVLPQLPKAFIRVKNDNVTVLMVKTYLVRKLGLSDESQVEISCMGQILLHSQELKKIRDEIWLPKFIEFQSSNPKLVRNSHVSTASIDHHLLLLMPLDYGKRCLSVYI